MMEHKKYYDEKAVNSLTEGYSKVDEVYEQLLLAYTSFKFRSDGGREYAFEGVSRRLGTLSRCIHNVYKIYPPDRSDKPSRDELVDLAINLQSFIYNIFGCIDNLAWIWVKENDLKGSDGKPLGRMKVGFMSVRENEIVRESLSKNFVTYLDSRNDWYNKYLKQYRDALAHRIPIYVPPYAVDPKNEAQYIGLEEQKNEALKELDFQKHKRLDLQQDELGFFRPWMMHSFSEGHNQMPFHQQLLCDWNTIVEMSEKFIEELGAVSERRLKQA